MFSKTHFFPLFLFIVTSLITSCQPNVSLNESPDVTHETILLEPFTLHNCESGGEKTFTKTVDTILNYSVGGDTTFGYDDIVKASLSNKYQTTVKEGITYYISIPEGYMDVITLDVNYSVRKGRFTINKLLSSIYGDYSIAIPESISEKKSKR